VYFPNWVELERFSKSTPNKQLLMQLGVDITKRIVLYSGNIGEKQGLENVVYAAKAMHAREDIHFLIVGDGVTRQQLQSLALSFNLSNITFAPLVPYHQLPGLLASADCHLVVQKSGASDTVMPSKLTNILAVGGNALITADEASTMGKLCLQNHGLATLIAPDSVPELIHGIYSVLEQPSPNKIAKNYANANFEKQRILRRFLADITPTPNNRG